MAKRAREEIQQSPIEADRVNEVGNRAEPYLVRAAASLGGVAERPKTSTGTPRSVGYPDLDVATPSGERFYLEVKTFRPDSEKSSLRSFFVSPSREPKVTRDAAHLLVAFGTEVVGPGQYSVKSVKLLDLSLLLIDLKIEVQASNMRMYRSPCVLRAEE
jgi:hypothetical protein